MRLSYAQETVIALDEMPNAADTLKTDHQEQ
jgi:hypothetical protein